MSKRGLVTFLLVITFLSGNFTLARLQLSHNFEVRYFLYGVFFLALIIISPHRGLQDRMKINTRLISFFILSFFYFLISIFSFFYSSNKDISFEKVTSILFIIALVLGVIYVMRLFEATDYYKFISHIFICFGLIYAVPIFSSVFSGSLRGSIDFGGPNVATRIMFFASMCSMFLYKEKKKLKYLLSTIIFLAAIIFLGSRGGVVGACGTLVLLWIIKNVLRKPRFKKFTMSIPRLFYSVIGIIVVFFIYEPVKRIFLYRVINTTFQSNGIYTAGRDILYAESIRMIKDKPIFGYGINGFKIETGEEYPHNLILELMNDIGLFGLLFFVCITLISLLLVFKSKKTNIYIFSGIPVYMLIVEMFSGGVYDFRYFFFWIIPLLYYSYGNEKGDPRII